MSSKDKVKEVVARRKKEQKRYRASMPLGQDNAGGLRGGTSSYINSTDFNRAQWLKADPRDEYYRLKKEYINERQPLGEAYVSEDDFNYLKDKKDQVEYLHFIDTAQYLIDPNRIETQQDTFQKFPELKTLPDKFAQKILGFQVRLKDLLDNGSIAGPEDHVFIMELCRYDTLLPLLPLWDFDGSMITKALIDLEAKGFGLGELTLGTLYEVQGWNKTAAEEQLTVRRGLFNPVRWSSGYREAGNNFYYGTGIPGNNIMSKQTQVALKVSILNRLYPGLREMPDLAKQEAIKKIMIKQSLVDGRPANDDVLGLLNLLDR